MKKIISVFFILIFLLISIFFVVLTTTGIETQKFNKLIANKINQSNKNINIELNYIKFKLDFTELSLFLETLKPKINYRNVFIPSENFKVYIDFKSLFSTNPKIHKVSIEFSELNVMQIKKITPAIKPSNFKNLIKERFIDGIAKVSLEIYLDENNLIENFIAKGYIKNLELKIVKQINLKKTDLNFFADKDDILLKNINGIFDNIRINDGDVKIELEPEISINSNFNTDLEFDNNSIDTIKDLVKLPILSEIHNTKASLKNNFSIIFDKTYKIKKYNFDSQGSIQKLKLKFTKSFKNNFFKTNLKNLSIIDADIKMNFNNNNNSTSILGSYSINNGNLLKFDLKNKNIKKKIDLNLDVDFEEEFNLDLINYQKNKGEKASLQIDLTKEKNRFFFNEIKVSERKNLIFIKDLLFEKNKILSFKKIGIKTFKDTKKNNDFIIESKKKFFIKGSMFDATNLPQMFSGDENKIDLSLFSKSIEIDMQNIIAPLSENLKNFKLLGFIEKGNFIKINAKGDFGNNKFLDISMSNKKDSKKKYLEIYSDLPKPLLSQYSFFNGLAGGKLLFTSIIDNESSNSKLEIENFKVINAPGIIKLLSLADLGGLADLAEGEGLSFEILEINMESKDGFLKLNEIYAIGPSVSVIMEGYKDKNGITSLRGTLVPAKTLNKLLAKIPVIGNIIIPKEIGEGLFGVSFKLKGPPGKIKTTINPIRTITPRFIQKIIEKKTNTR